MYIVVEIQNNKETIGNIVTSYHDYNEAQSKYYQVLAAAAISNVPIHAAVLLHGNGSPIENKYFEHEDLKSTNEN